VYEAPKEPKSVFIMADHQLIAIEIPLGESEADFSANYFAGIKHMLLISCLVLPLMLLITYLLR